ncbi:uncharacterized protein [Macrobrachium rosenbergii]|uniref:uncharacterized protein n=1 Tax=Macrobrachium rosenbergii TaxID=79674 RepID=UPI0034D77507
MEWHRSRCMTLIAEYEKRPVLWDPEHGSYFNKTKKLEQWEEVAQVIGCTVEEVKRKMDSLLGSFRRERGKANRHKGNDKGGQKPFVSRWFAYKPMAFLLERDDPRPSSPAAAKECPRPPMGMEANKDATRTSHLEQHQEPRTSSCPTGTEGDKERNVIKRRKMQHAKKASTFQDGIAFLNVPRDDNQIFGEYVAAELRQIRSDERRRRLKRTIQKAIVVMGEEEDAELSS